ncbi:MAG: nucleotidyltransferase family protein [Cyanobacteria bacterium P01_F01_bin.143]
MKPILSTDNIHFEQIYETLQQYLTKLQEQYQVKTLGIFGSYARGEATDNSDLDLLVEFQGDLTFDNYMDLKFFLEDLFNKKIDLVIRDDIKAQIREKVLEKTVYVS